MSSIGAVSNATVTSPNNLAQQAAQAPKPFDKDGDEATETKVARAKEATASHHKVNVKA